MLNHPRLTVAIPASFGSSTRVSHLRVDDTHGDAYTVWVSQGKPANPSAAQLTALQQAMDPSQLGPDETFAVAADGTVGVEFELPRFGVSLVAIQPADAASDGGPTTLPARTGTGGCTCGVSGRNKGTVNTTALFGTAMLALAVIARRRSAKVPLLHPFA